MKGEQKQGIIEKFCRHTEVINMEDLGCPRLNQLLNNDTDVSSIPCYLYHSHLNHKSCTFYKMLVLKKWFINNYCILFSQ